MTDALAGWVVTWGVVLTVRVAALLVADPAAFVQIARYWLAFCASDVGVSVSVAEVCPVRPFQVVPPSVESCHWVVGAGLPEHPTVKEAGLGAVTVSGVGCVVTCGAVLIVTDWAVWALDPPLRLTV